MLVLSFRQLILVTVLACLLKVVVLAIYRLKWHPLSRYPGPLLAKISDWYAAYQAFRGNLHIDVLRAHQKYGNTIRYGPNRLVTNTAEGLQDIYHSASVKKSRAYLGIRIGPPNVHNAIDKALHRRRRKALREELSADALQQIEPIILRRSSEWVTCMISHGCERWAKPVNVANSCKYLMFDIMSECCLGRSFDLQKDPTNRYMVHGLAPLHKFRSAIVQSLDLTRYQLDKILCLRALWYGWKFVTAIRHCVFNRPTTRANSKNSLISSIIAPKSGNTEPSPPPSLQDLWPDIKFILITGSSSPASALAATLFYITRYPRCYDRLVDEIRSTFPTAADIRSGPQMSSCRYLRACITEALRMSPAAGGVLWREVEEPGISIPTSTSTDDNNGPRFEFVPPGYDVGVGIYAIHHNEKYFPDPFTFRPERWLYENDSDSNGHDAVSSAKQAYTPFSMGPRQCLGMHLARMELEDTLALLLWQCDLRRPAAEVEEARNGDGYCGGVGEEGEAKGPEDEFRQWDHVLSFFDGPVVEVRRWGA